MPNTGIYVVAQNKANYGLIVVCGSHDSNDTDHNNFGSSRNSGEEISVSLGVPHV